jgi:hypothetical protein
MEKVGTEKMANVVPICDSLSAELQVINPIKAGVLEVSGDVMVNSLLVDSIDQHSLFRMLQMSYRSVSFIR